MFAINQMPEPPDMPAFHPPGPDMQVFRLPIPPSKNKLHSQAVKRSREGQAFVGRSRSPAYREWRELAGWSLRAQRLRPYAGPVAVAYLVCPASPLRDADSADAACNDLLQHCGIVANDRQIKQRQGWIAQGSDEVWGWIWSLPESALAIAPGGPPPKRSPARVRRGKAAVVVPRAAAVAAGGR